MRVHEGTFLCQRYELLELVGRGGMAEVYLAFDHERQAQVAVKVLREDLGEDPDFVRRFRHEADALARLNHPRIVRFYGFDQDGPTAFIVMEYIEGTTLRRQIQEQRGPLALRAVTGILRDLCSALHYAHVSGYVHRDLKPGNVMLKQGGEALLTDFGVVRAAGGVTLTAETMGTPAYMSPEQIEGEKVDARSDIYSLGVLLFEMATGRRPFTGSEQGLTQTGTAARIHEAHLRVLPPDPCGLNPQLPRAAGAVILRALAKNPSGRWPDVKSLLSAWEAATGTAPAPPPKPKMDDEDVIPAHPRPRPVRLVALSATILLLAVAAITALLMQIGGSGLRDLFARSEPAPAAGDPAPTAVEPAPAPQASPPPAATPNPTAPAQPTLAVTGVQVATAPPIIATPETPPAPNPVNGGAPTPPTVAPTVKVEAVQTPTPPALQPTRAPTVRPTQAPPAPSPVPTSAGGVDLVTPIAGQSVIGLTEFVWQPQAGLKLSPGERYELIVWDEGEDPLTSGRGPVGATDATRVRADLTGVEAALGLADGRTYYWGVRLIGADNRPLRMLSAGWRFVYVRSSSSSGPDF